MKKTKRGLNEIEEGDVLIYQIWNQDNIAVELAFDAVEAEIEQVKQVTESIPAWSLNPTPPSIPSLAELGGLPITGGAMTGNLVANSAPFGTAAVRNSTIGTVELEPGVSPLPTGQIHFVLEME